MRPALAPVRDPGAVRGTSGAELLLCPAPPLLFSLNAQWLPVLVRGDSLGKEPRFCGGDLPHFSCSVAQSCPTLCDPGTAALQASLSFTISRSLPKLMFTEPCSGMSSHHLIRCHLLPSLFPSIRIFPRESALRIRWPKYRSFSFQHQSFQ